MELKNQTLIRTKSYINGQWCDADDGREFVVTDPATGAELARAADCGAAETARAISAAQQAFASFKMTTAKERAALLRRWHQLIMDNQEDLAVILSAEQGKPLAESRGEIAYGASYLEWYAEEAKRAYGDVIPTFANDKRIITLKQPVGVVAAITPWNFPSAMITRKVAPALAVGCPIVVKPSEETPLSALALAELAEQAGYPAGVFSVVCGTDAAVIGGVMTSNPSVRKISFTGSTRVGKLLMEQSASTVKKVSMELGGNAPFIVFDDADLDAAVAGAMASKYRNAGQTCVCANRLLVQDGVYDAFADKLAEAVAGLKTGAYTVEGANVGPLINRAALAKVNGLVRDALDKGATALAGGVGTDGDSQFYTPTILTNVTAEMDIFNEEIFGPVAPLYRFGTEQEAIEMANDTPFGLASYFYARDMGRVWRVSEALEYGMVGINEGIISNEAAPFGGVKESGIGREGSRYGLDDYLELKYLCMGGI
ncbi:NAD-dependent succinate-semialdehyde dehydrogenase [Emcibacter nanhaiensis]|uniref:NAD-dependent succinate-semialdehyde dehydrogenase n=1 Tax=Emcibacter nanhaiensis TaxID=1505037 RepID=A0A501PMS1_9PROT|nr:NAD-dependent succinate-semialdehyde dehydrogenase [Emcibacter nanhaiensis]TPD61458.1 NAD-dependent succinate-semialdehyde dehydrogenase [Emcibacter nanhaiensis]